MKKESKPHDNGKIPIDRRKLLKTLGASSVSVPGLFAASSPTAAAGDWNCNNGCPHEKVVSDELDLPSPPGGGTEKLEGSAAIHWKESGYSSEKDSWFHIFSVSGGASSETSGLTGGYVYGQHYKLETSDGDLQPSTQGNRHGQLPNDDSDEFIPGWGAPLLEASIGTLSAGISWFLAVDDALREKFGRRPDGFDIFGGGFEYGDMAANTINPSPWMRSAFFHRVELETEEFSPIVDVKMGICHHDSAGATLWEDLEGELEFFGSSGDPEFSTASASEPDPTQMSPETREKYGIKEVSEKQSAIAPQSTNEDVSIDYVVTKSPISVDALETVERDESEMDNPRSERFRDRLGKTAPDSY